MVIKENGAVNTMEAVKINTKEKDLYCGPQAAQQG